MKFQDLKYGPGDWLVAQSSVRGRRALGAWALIVYTISIPVRYLFRNQVWMVWGLSEIAIVLALLAFIASETPVSIEKEE